MATLKWHSIRTKLNRCKLAFPEGDLISIDGGNGASIRDQSPRRLSSIPILRSCETGPLNNNGLNDVSLVQARFEVRDLVWSELLMTMPVAGSKR
jgi:hypothetical protein